MKNLHGPKDEVNHQNQQFAVVIKFPEETQLVIRYGPTSPASSGLWRSIELDESDSDPSSPNWALLAVRYYAARLLCEAFDAWWDSKRGSAA